MLKDAVHVYSQAVHVHLHEGGPDVLVLGTRSSIVLR
jgi:hypothetical protein